MDMHCSSPVQPRALVLEAELRYKGESLMKACIGYNSAPTKYGMLTPYPELQQLELHAQLQHDRDDDAGLKRLSE